MIDNEETEPKAPVFDTSAYPPDTLFHERRHRRDPRLLAPATDAAVPCPKDASGAEP